LSAAPLDPNAFTSLGTLDVSAGTLTINTDTLAISGAAAFTGVVHVQGPGLPDIAVFTFDDIDIAAAVTINFSGTRPLAFLSQGDVAIDTTINLNGGDGGAYSSTMGGAGGLAGPAGGHAGGAGGSPGPSEDGATGAGSGAGNGGLVREGSFETFYEGGSGAGFGGSGGPGYQGSPLGGISYGDLLTRLEGGSGGGGGARWSDLFPPSFGGNGGGGGGGAVEIGAAGNVMLATIAANGGSGMGDPSDDARSGGGGSGGGILVHGNFVNVTSGLNAGGGPAFSGFSGGGGGGGGRVTVLGGSSHILGEPVQGIYVNGSFGAGFGKAGVITLAPALVIVPDGGSFVFTEAGIVFTSGTESSDPTIVVLVQRDLTVQSGGQAELGASEVLASNAQLTVEGTGVIDVAGFSQTVATLSGDGEVRIDSDGLLTVGDGGATSTFSGNVTGVGDLRKTGTGSLTLTGANAYSGTTFVDQGTLILSNSLSTPGGSIDIASDGAVQASGIVQRSPVGMGTIGANGSLLIGNLSSPSGFEFGGSLEVGSHLVQLLDADKAELGAATTLAAGGRLTALNGIELGAGGALTATGPAEIDGDFTNLGTVNGPTAIGQYLAFADDVDGPGGYTGNVAFSDGLSTGDDLAVIAPENVLFDPSARLRLKLGGLVPGIGHDQLNVTGTAILAGTLEVVLVDDFQPAPDDAFDILNWDTRIGTFSSLLLPDLAGSLSWDTSQLYVTGELSVDSGLPGDYNNDGKVSAADFTVWRDHVGALTLPNRDPSNSGPIDNDDFDSWIANYGSGAFGAGSDTTASVPTSVPEPATAFLLIVACMIWKNITKRRG
jgi:autotransporter-associated beta strand protein